MFDKWKPFKIDEKCFYFTLKTLFVLKIFKFFANLIFGLFAHLEKRLNRKDKVNFKIYDLTTWKTNNGCKYSLIPKKSKINQTINFSQLIEYNMRNIFLEKSFKKCGEETIPRSFFEKSKLSISPD